MSEGRSIELISGPGTLDEYLSSRAQYTMREIHAYEKGLNETHTMKKETAAIIQRKKAEFARFDDARQALAGGDKDPGITILKDEMKEIAEGIRFNREQGNNDAANEQTEVLVTLQMLLKDETGEEPRFYGYRSTGNEEGYTLPETVGRNDLVTAALFKTVMAFGSYSSPSSGYYPSPESVNPETVITRLFDYDSGLTAGDKKSLIKHMQSVIDAINDFADENFKYNYERSYPRFPDPKMKPHELVRYSKYNDYSPTPNALFYMEGSEIKCRFSGDKEKSVQVTDITTGNEGLEVATVAKVNGLKPELETKVLTLLNSEELEERWEELAPRTHKPQILFAQ